MFKRVSLKHEADHRIRELKIVSSDMSSPTYIPYLFCKFAPKNWLFLLFLPQTAHRTASISRPILRNCFQERSFTLLVLHWSMMSKEIIINSSQKPRCPWFDSRCQILVNIHSHNIGIDTYIQNLNKYISNRQKSYPLLVSACQNLFENIQLWYTLM